MPRQFNSILQAFTEAGEISWSIIIHEMLKPESYFIHVYLSQRNAKECCWQHENPLHGENKGLRETQETIKHLRVY
jgi:hypothetical protein